MGLSSNPGQGTKVLQKAARKQVKNQNQSPVPQTTMTEKTSRETILKKIKKERSFGKIDDCRKPRQFWKGFLYQIACAHRAQLLNHFWLFTTPGTTAHQMPLCMEFSRQEYWNGLPFPTPGDLPGPAIKSLPSASPALTGKKKFFFPTTEPLGKPFITCQILLVSSLKKTLHFLF